MKKAILVYVQNYFWKKLDGGWEQAKTSQFWPKKHIFDLAGWGAFFHRIDPNLLANLLIIYHTIIICSGIWPTYYFKNVYPPLLLVGGGKQKNFHIPEQIPMGGYIISIFAKRVESFRWKNAPQPAKSNFGICVRKEACFRLCSLSAEFPPKIPLHRN